MFISHFILWNPLSTRGHPWELYSGYEMLLSIANLVHSITPDTDRSLHEKSLQHYNITP